MVGRWEPTLPRFHFLKFHFLKSTLARPYRLLYLAAARGAMFERKDIDAYTEEILLWWRNNSHEFPTWAKAARMIFAMTPNSAM